MTHIIRKSPLLISLLLAFVTTANAQQSAAPPIVPIVPLEPRVDNPDEVIGLIVLRDETALQVLDMLEKMTGKIILRRQDIAAVKINFNSRGELTKGEAVLALESLLSLNSIMLTDMGGRFMKAVPATSVNSHVPEMIVGSTLGLARESTNLRQTVQVRLLTGRSHQRHHRHPAAVAKLQRHCLSQIKRNADHRCADQSTTHRANYRRDG